MAKGDSGPSPVPKKPSKLKRRSSIFTRGTAYKVDAQTVQTFRPYWYNDERVTFKSVMEAVQTQGGAYLSKTELEQVRPLEQDENQILFLEELNDFCLYFIHYFLTSEDKAKRMTKPEVVFMKPVESKSAPNGNTDGDAGVFQMSGIGQPTRGTASQHFTSQNTINYDRASMHATVDFLRSNLPIAMFFGKVSNKQGISRLRFILYCAFLIELDADTPDLDKLQATIACMEAFDKGQGVYFHGGRQDLKAQSVFHGPLQWTGLKTPWEYYRQDGARTWVDELNCDLDFRTKLVSIMKAEASSGQVPVFLGCLSFSMILGNVNTITTLLENNHCAKSCKTEALHLVPTESNTAQHWKNSINKVMEALGQELRLGGTTGVVQPYDFAMVWWQYHVKLKLKPKSDRFNQWRQAILSIETASDRAKKRANRKCLVAVFKIAIFHAWKIWVIMIILFTGFGVDGTNFYRVKTNVLKYLVDTPRDNTRGTRFTEISSLKEFETWTETVLLDVLFGSNTCETLLFSPDQVNKNCAGLMTRKIVLDKGGTNENMQFWEDPTSECCIVYCDSKFQFVGRQAELHTKNISCSTDPLETYQSTAGGVYFENTKLEGAQVSCIPGPFNSGSMFVIGETVRIRHATLGPLANKRCNAYPGSPDSTVCAPVYQPDRRVVLGYDFSNEWKQQWLGSRQNISGVKYISDYRPFNPSTGRHYPLGGNAFDLSIKNKSSALEKLISARRAKWINIPNGAQAAFVELAVWVPRAHVLLPVRLTVEFQAGGRALPNAMATVFPVLSEITKPPGTAWNAYYSILVALPLMKEGAQLAIERLGYFKNIWSLLELLVIGLTLFFLEWYENTITAAQAITISSDTYNQFETVEIRLKWLNWGCGIGMTLMVFQMLETFKTLGDPYGLQIAGIMMTMSREEILGILGLVFGIVFAFSYGQYITFGADVEAYNSIAYAFESMSFVMFGEFGNQLDESQKIWNAFATIVFMIFVLLIALVMMNILIALVGTMYESSLELVALERDMNRFSQNFHSIEETSAGSATVGKPKKLVEIIASMMGDKRRHLSANY